MLQTPQTGVREQTTLHWRKLDASSTDRLAQCFRSYADADQLELEIAGRGLVLNRLDTGI